MSTEDNDFTKILTTTPPTTSRANKGLARTNSWFHTNDNQLVTCPSCKGTGHKETTNELVALIPYSDERLQPRHTTLKVLIALAITAVVISTLFFVFYPRHADASSTNLEIASGNISSTFENGTWLLLTDHLLIKNENYFPISIQTLNVSLAISWYSDNEVYSEVGNIMKNNIPIPAHNSNVTLVYDIMTTSYPVDRLFRTCCYIFATHYIWFRVTVNVKFKLTFVGTYYFSANNVVNIPVECDYITNNNISCSYDF